MGSQDAELNLIKIYKLKSGSAPFIFHPVEFYYAREFIQEADRAADPVFFHTTADQESPLLYFRRMVVEFIYFNAAFKKNGKNTGYR
jgi:hypothetical protein